MHTSGSEGSEPAHRFATRLVRNEACGKLGHWAACRLLPRGSASRTILSSGRVSEFSSMAFPRRRTWPRPNASRWLLEDPDLSEHCRRPAETRFGVDLGVDACHRFFMRNSCLVPGLSISSWAGPSAEIPLELALVEERSRCRFKRSSAPWCLGGRMSIMRHPEKRSGGWHCGYWGSPRPGGRGE